MYVYKCSCSLFVLLGIEVLVAYSNLRPRLLCGRMGCTMHGHIDVAILLLLCVEADCMRMPVWMLTFVLSLRTRLCVHVHMQAYVYVRSMCICST